MSSPILRSTFSNVGAFERIRSGRTEVAPLTWLQRVLPRFFGDASQRAATVGQASEKALGNVQAVAAAAEELSASVAEISRQVAQSSEVARLAVGEAEQTNSTVQQLSGGAEKIGAVVQLIQSIAEHKARRSQYPIRRAGFERDREPYRRG